ncbi:MAG: site-specific DNA-methyltransferase [Acholeplasmatales bacterium]|jgi:adenine-specific DNA-methyltransferase|nr:site-specific DNA-methyltransferase [Acholeplasmatales bacterium]
MDNQVPHFQFNTTANKNSIFDSFLTAKKINIKNNNIFVGDNLDIMSDLFFLNAYKNSVSFIYIDPPYNTFNNFSYNDSMKSEEWNDFMEKRILASYSLMLERGCIFISIDDNEYANLKIICDKIFGKNNFIGTFITKQSQRSNTKLINVVHEYVVCYAKNIKKVNQFKISRMDIPSDANMIKKLYSDVKICLEKNGYNAASKYLKELVKKYCEEYGITWLINYNNLSEDGKIYFAKDLSTPGNPRTVDIPSIGLHLEPLHSRGWSSDSKFLELFNNNRLVYKDGRPYSVTYLEESEDNAPSMLNFYSRFGTNDLKKLGIDGLFDTPKPVDMIKYFIRLVAKKDDIILDYFAGSGTTGQAVLELNNDLDLNLSVALIQIDEEICKKTKVYKKCIEIGIKPNLINILSHRLKTFCYNRNIDYSFKIYKK